MRSSALPAALLLAACFQDAPFTPTSAGDATADPSGDPSATTAETETAASETASETATSEPATATADPSTSTSTTTDPSTSSTTDPSTSSTTDPSTSTTDPTTTTTAGGDPFAIALAADIATCSLHALNEFPYLGAAQCESYIELVHDTLPGIMAVDTTLTADWSDRPALSYLRFNLPEDLGGAVIAADLEVVVGLGTNDGGPNRGHLRRAAPFTLASLQSAPPVLEAILTPDPGPISAGAVALWSLPLEAITLGQPLHLAIEPLSTDGVLYRSNSATDVTLRPRLRLTIQP